MNEASRIRHHDGPRSRRLPAALAGLVGLAATLALLIVEPRGFFQGYLFGFVFWVDVSLGCLALLMLHHLVAGEWGLVVQRILESGASTILAMALFFVPVLFGMHHLYEWTDTSAVASSPALQHKSIYLNVPWFIIRSAVYFSAWCSAAVLLPRWSALQDETGDVRYTKRMRALSAGGLVAHVVLMTFASVDWIMSIEPHWLSTVYGWLVEVSQVLSALVVTIVTLTAVRTSSALDRVVRAKHYHDLGNLVLTFVILWAYMMFSQYLIIWSGNIPEDVRWYVHRQSGGWFAVGPFLLICHLVVPFALLLLRRTKRSARALTALACALFGVHAVFVAWLILPGFSETSWVTFAAAGTAFIGVGGCWFALFLTRMGRRPLLPAFDPRFADVLQERERPT